MARITYFQRYSKKENVVTNNTMLLLSRIYEYSPQSFQDLINRLADLEDHDPQIEIGPVFRQQERSGPSVPDGSIFQPSFHLLIETKIGGGQPHVGQLSRHVKSLSKRSGMKILLVLAERRSDRQRVDDIRKQITREDTSVVFRALTFRDLCDEALGLFEQHERDIRTIVADYKDYCGREGILGSAEDRMRIVPCGKSHELNRRYGIYFHPSNRGYQEHAYLGIYAGKRVTSLWKIRCVFDATLDGEDRLSRERVDGDETPEYDQKLISIIKSVEQGLGWNIRSGFRFFCGEPFDTNFTKSSKYGLPKNTYVNIEDYIQNVDLNSPEAVADALRKCQWQ